MAKAFLTRQDTNGGDKGSIGVSPLGSEPQPCHFLTMWLSAIC